jgi:hypothetical protein
MIKKLIKTIILFLFTVESMAQCIEENNDLGSPPCNGVISTNPSNPINLERPTMANLFDWKSPLLQVYHPLGGYTGPNSQMANPYLTDFEYLSYLNYYAIPFSERSAEKMDFYPEDGWELIHKGNGYKMDGVTQLPTNENRVGPYFIMYNKYTSLLRVFAGINNIGANQGMYTQLDIKGATGLYYNSLFSKYGSSISPLNTEAQVSRIVQGSPATVGGQFFSSDFRINYDPCICNYPSVLYMRFGTRNTGDIQLEGRLIGTSTPLDNSGQPPLQNGRNFLTSVFSDPSFSVKGGMLTYSNIDRLADLYYTPSSGLPVIGIDGRSALVDLLKNVGKSADEDLAKSRAVTSAISGFLRVGPELSALQTSVSGILKALGPVGAATSLLSGLLTPKTSTPSVSVIEAELALRGSVLFQTSIANADIEFAAPGSKFTNNPAQVPDNKYPLYNEALGTFAVFEKPRVRLNAGSRAYEANSLKYYFNPAVPINLQNTKILAALIINYPTVAGTLTSGPTNTFPTGNKNEFSTDFVPLESLHRIYVGPTNIAVPIVSLRIQIFYEFLPNPNGKVIRNWEVLTYPTDVSSNPIWAGDDYDRTFNAWNYTSSGNSLVLRNVAVNGALTNSPGVATTIRAGNSVVLNTNSSIGAGMVMQAVPVTALYNDLPTQPVAPSYVKSFCSSLNTQYKARELSPAVRLALEEQEKREKEAKKNMEETTAYPNPTTGNVYFRYYVEEPSQVRLNLVSTTGTVVATPVDAYQEEGPYEFAYDASNQPAGIYIYTLETSKGKETKRLVVIK